MIESKDSTSKLNSIPVFKIKEAYVSINVVDLFSSNISASEISFENGSINLIVYPDSQINIVKAIKGANEDEYEAKDELSKADSTKKEEQNIPTQKPELSLHIENLEFVNILVNAENKFKKNKIQFRIERLQSDFSYKQKEITASIDFDGHIDSLIKNNASILSDLQIGINSNLQINPDSVFVSFNEGNISIGKAQFQFNGIFNSKNEGYIDVSVKGVDEDFSLFSLFLSETGLRNLKSGRVDLEARVNGKTYSEFPVIDVSFGLSKVFLTNPITKREIKNLNLTGNFTSGKNDDWSEAELIIDTLYADLPDGFVKLSGSINNFTQPQLNLILFLSADVTGLDKLFSLGTISDLQGKIEITDKIVGKYLISEKRYVNEMNEAKISFEDFGLNVPGTIRFDNINGIIKRNNDDLEFANLKVVSEGTDFLINGEVKNAMALLFNREEDITGDLQIKSKVFDLPNFLFFDPSIKRDFNHRILDIDVDVIAKTSTSKAAKFKSFPEIEFQIRKINATAEGFLPRLKINSGTFKISENILGFNLKFTNFKTDFLTGNFNFTGEYNTSKYQPFYIKAETNFKNINLSELFYAAEDTIPEIMNGKLSGKFFTELQFPTDSLVLKYVKIKNSNVVYEFSKDTITAKNFQLFLTDIYFNDKINPNPLATIFLTAKLKSDIISSRNFNFSDLDFSINSRNGTFEIRSEVVRLFGENARGNSTFTLSPFVKNPKYSLVFNDVNFNAEKLLESFNENPVIAGPLNLSLNLTSSGEEWENIVDNIQGTISLSGENLSLNGLDADEIIDKFKRSQNFNLIDLGAVLLAGPVGLAVTKGTDFARVFVFNSGKTTKIVKMVSNWEIISGVFKIEDAAFATNKNRVALVGSIGFADQELDLTIALLNKNGCSIFIQDVFGDLNSPELGKVKVVGTLLAPVKNLTDDLLGVECDVFYSGSVEHPK
ncbi:MAG: hypothetical protein IPM14_12260 [bacterium]|nr:hypothetical protein [bacterium]